MTENDDDIPVLTDTLPRVADDDSGLAPGNLAALEARLCRSSLQLAEDLLRDASREAEHVLKERVMTELRAELPAMISRVLREHFDR